MIVAKQIADLITFARLSVAVLMIWLGIRTGEEALPIVVWLMLFDWVGDLLDGTLARRSRKKYHSWIGDHDLEIDMSVAAGLLLFMMAAKLVNPIAGWFYFAIWGIVFLLMGIPASLGMLFQAPVYGYLLWISMVKVPQHGLWLLLWILTAVIITWPRFPREVVPGFLLGFNEVIVPNKKRRK